MIDAVVKLGGGILKQDAHFEAAAVAIEAAARVCRLLVVPGGGPFADAVRDVDRRMRLSDDAAHWMAILAMDQHAHLVADRLAGAVLVTGRNETADALGRGQAAGAASPIPVLAPYRWLRQADPLPHSWEVTSDSIAAWVAGQLDARRLVLVKPPGAGAGEAVDVYFTRALPAGVTPTIVPVDRIEGLRSVLG